MTRPNQSVRRTRVAACGRAGALTVWVLVALGMLLPLVALALDLAWIWHHHLRLQAASEAGALAGAAELMDPSHLYPGGEPNQMPELTVASYVVPLAARIEHARERALHFAGLNGMIGEPLVLDTADSGGQDRDLVVGWVEDPTSLGNPMDPWTGTGPVNSMWVRAARSPSRGNPITLWFAGTLGIGSPDVAAAARATVDQRVYGFRPAGHVRVPLVPVLSLLGRNYWLPPPSAEDAQDDYMVDVRTGDVVPGADGLPEITLYMPGPAASSDGECPETACVLSLTGQAPEWGVVEDHVLHGLTLEHLAELGGQFALGSDGRLVLATAPQPSANDLSSLRAALLAVRGKPRVWPVGDRLAESSGGGLCQVVDFVAGSVVACEIEDGCLKIVIQPCLIETCTALVGEGRSRNLWIGKLVLSQ